MKKQRILVSVIVAIMLSSQLQFAKAAEITEQEYYNILSKFTSSQPYDALKVLTQAHKDYPNNQVFIDQINSRVRVILDWSIGSHKNKKYDAADYGYKTVASVDVIPDYLKSLALRQDENAKLAKDFPSSTEYYNIALNNSIGQSPYVGLSLYDEALAAYPNNAAIINGIASNANTIMDWSLGSHKNKAYSAAIYGYETIINAPGVPQNIKDMASKYLSYAKQNIAIYSAEEYQSMASKLGDSQPYEALKLLVEANNLYPNDSRFIKGINDRVSTILEWSMGSHRNKAYSAAAYGYQTIRNTTAAAYYMRNFADRQLNQTSINKDITTVDEYVNIAKSYGPSRPYQALDVYNEAQIIYKNDTKILNGINDSAKVILNWSKGSHDNRAYDAAIYGYKIIANVDANGSLKDYAVRQMKRAAAAQMPYQESEYVDLLKQNISSNPYSLLALANEAAVMYPNNNIALESANRAAGIILEWSEGSHKKGYYDAAIYGYNTILNSSLVNNNIVSSTKYLLQMAEKGVYGELGGMTIVLDAGHNYGGDDGAYGNGYSERELNMEVVELIKPLMEKLGATVLLTRKPGEISYADSGTSLEQRADMANKANADLFLSIHHDSDSSSANGTSAYYSSYRTQLDTSDVYVNIQEDCSIRGGNSGGTVIGYAKKGQNFGYIREENGGFIINYNGKLAWVSNEYCRAYDPTPSTQAGISKELAQYITGGISSLGLANRGVTDRNLYVTRYTNMPSVLVEVGFISNKDEANKISKGSFQQQVAQKIVDAVKKLFSKVF